jgi:hypothetical protein
MNIYLAGPMRGIKDFNFPAFFQKADELRSQGHTVFNPAERDIKIHGPKVAYGNETGDLAVATKEHGFNLRDALGADLEWICKEADAIALLPGWEKSKGASAERAVGLALGLEILELEGEDVKWAA